MQGKHFQNISHHILDGNVSQKCTNFAAENKKVKKKTDHETNSIEFIICYLSFVI